MRRAAALLLAALAVAACGSSGGHDHPAAAASTARHSSAPAPGPGDYLALGDSVVFGYDPAVSPLQVTRFVGYPTYVARDLGLALTNASCPGEASGGFLSPTGTDNGCRAYRSVFPLHTTYSGTQMDFAVGFLRTHPRTRLVTVMLGANDLFACQRDTPDHCLGNGELTHTLDSVRRNLTTVLQRLRAVYRGTIVAVTYYNPRGSDATATAGVRLLDGTVADAARTVHARVADGYGAYAGPTASTHGDACAAGLLATKPSGGCDIHPSQAGARRLAQAVVAAVRAD